MMIESILANLLGALLSWHPAPAQMSPIPLCADGQLVVQAMPSGKWVCPPTVPVKEPHP